MRFTKFLKFILFLLIVQVVYVAGSSVRFGWDHAGEVDHYELQMLRQRTVEVFAYGTANKSLSVPRPKSGKYEVRVKTVVRNEDGTYSYSDWCSSVSSCAKLKDGSVGTWIVNFKPLPPRGPITTR